MKDKRKISVMVTLALLLGLGIGVRGELTMPKGISSDDIKAGFTRSGQSVGLDMTIHLDSMKLKRNQRVILRPLLCGEQDTVAFTPVVINGRNAAITYERNSKERISGATVIKANQEERDVNYSSRLPYQEWMDNSQVYVVEDDCGCGVTKSGELDSFSPVASISRKSVGNMSVAYKVPEVEAVKERSETGSAYVDFPVNRTELYPDYHNNTAELSKILQTIEVVKNDSHITIEGITIHGYASPEGSYSNNTRLADGRSKTLTSYVSALSGVDKSKFSTQSTPEDWAGLRKYVASSGMSNASGILSLIDSDMEPDKKDAAIKAKYPEDYQKLLTEVYPVLRHSDYTVTYQVRPFTLEETKEYIETHPEYLSLDEFFTLANSYTDDPEERAKVLYKAAAMFPRDETAQLNAACAALEGADYTTAERYLSGAGSSAVASNARGILAMQQGDYAKAMQLFEEAVSGGCEDAGSNLEVVKAISSNSLQQVLED